MLQKITDGLITAAIHAMDVAALRHYRAELQDELDTIRTDIRNHHCPNGQYVDTWLGKARKARRWKEGQLARIKTILNDIGGDD